MQAPILNSPTPNPETLNMIRGPAAQPQADGQTAPAEAAAPTQDGQAAQRQDAVPQVPQAPQGTIPQGTAELPQGAAVLPSMMLPQGGAVQLPGMDQLPELPAAELSGLPLPGLLVPRQDGNFFAFLQRLADTPSFSEGMNRLLLEFDPAASGTELPEELDALLRQLPQDEVQAAALLRQQASGGSRFTGELFDLVREAYTQSTSKEAKTEILQFLRRFNDYTSSEHIERSLVRTLGQLAKASPREYTVELEAFAQTLEQTLSGGDRAGALKLLQGKILPFLTDISDRHPDMRLPNTLISIFKPLAVRYENSGEEGLLQALRQLAEHSVLKPKLSGRSTGDLLKLVKETDFARAREEQRFAEQLAKTADWAMKGKGGGEPRRIFRQLVSNMLLNKSVYLPLEHAILPMMWNGRRLVSELWIDPDAGRGQRTENDKERLIRFLLHMDIPGLGPFDLALASRGEEVEIQLACPEAVVPFSQLIHEEMTRILENNGLKAGGIQVKKWEKPMSLSAAFPKVAKGENGVNLKV